MVSRFKRTLSLLDLEERIFNGAAILTLVSLFLPWLSGEGLGGDSITYNAFQSYISFIGFAVCLILIAILLLTFVPLLGGPIILKRQYKESIRFFMAVQVLILILASLSVLMQVTYELTHTSIRFGLYLAMIGSIVMVIYAFLKWQEYRKSMIHEHFHHPEDHLPHSEIQESTIPPPPPPPPPPPLQPEEHRIIR